MVSQTDKKPLTPKPLTPAPQVPKILQMDFPEAMRRVIDGKKVKRVSWGSVQDYGFLRNGWLMIFTKGAFHVWKVNDGDMEGKDWVEVVEKKLYA